MNKNPTRKISEHTTKQEKTYAALVKEMNSRQAAEDKLKASFAEIQELKAALDEHAIVAITNPQGKITYVNDKFCAISKYSRKELLGQDHRIINSGYHSKEFIKKLWTTIAHGQVWHGEIKNRTKDGSFYWVDTTIVPFFDEHGKPRQYVAIRADITERKEAADQIRKLNEELEQRVHQRTQELEAANEELKAFSYTISHDLRAPLRAMGGFARILETQLGGTLTPDAKHAMKRIQENATKMGELIDGLLDFSSLNWRPVTKSKTRPGEIARMVFEDLRPEFAGRQVEIQIDNLPACEADPTLLRQVFVNLLSNAIKYSRDRNPAIIHVGSEKDGGETAYFVQDNGAGFNMEYSDKLFRVFQRLHTTEQFAGTGVGLAIVQRIVQRHGGRVWAEGAEERGAKFFFTIGRYHA